MRGALCIALLLISCLGGACVQHAVTWSTGAVTDGPTEVAITGTETIHIIDDVILLVQAHDDPEQVEVAQGHDARIRAISARDGRELWRTTVQLDVDWGVGVHRVNASNLVIASGPDLVRIDARNGRVRWQATHPDQAQQEWFLLGGSLYGCSGDTVIEVSASSGRERRTYELPVRGSLVAVQRWRGRPTAVVADALARTSTSLVPLGRGTEHETIGLQAEVDGAAGAGGELLLAAAGYLNGGSVVARIPRRGERTIRPMTDYAPCWSTSFGAVCGEIHSRSSWSGPYERSRLNLMRLTAFGVGRSLQEPLWRVSVPSSYSVGILRQAPDGQLIVVDDSWLHVLEPDSGRIVHTVAREYSGGYFCSAYGIASGHLVEGCFEQDTPVLRLTPVAVAAP